MGNAFADRFLVAIDGSTIDMTVAGVQGSRDGFRDITLVEVPSAEAQGWDLGELGGSFVQRLLEIVQRAAKSRGGNCRGRQQQGQKGGKQHHQSSISNRMRAGSWHME